MNKLSKISIRKLADNIAARSTSNGTRLDPDAFYENLWETTRRCIFCSKPSYVFGILDPSGHSDPVLRSGLAKGQARFLFYGLCVKCYQEEDAFERVEDKIADDSLEEANFRAELDAAGATYTKETASDGTDWICISHPGAVA
jgi:hypothetical protein